MLGSRVIQRKERQLRIGIRQQIEIVTEIPAFTGGILILHDTIHSREIEFSETEVDLSNCRRLGSPVDPIHASNSIQKQSVVKVRVDES